MIHLNRSRTHLMGSPGAIEKNLETRSMPRFVWWTLKNRGTFMYSLCRVLCRNLGLVHLCCSHCLANAADVTDAGKNSRWWGYWMIAEYLFQWRRMPTTWKREEMSRPWWTQERISTNETHQFSMSISATILKPDLSFFLRTISVAGVPDL